MKPWNLPVVPKRPKLKLPDIYGIPPGGKPVSAVTYEDEAGVERFRFGMGSRIK